VRKKAIIRKGNNRNKDTEISKKRSAITILLGKWEIRMGKETASIKKRKSSTERGRKTRGFSCERGGSHYGKRRKRLEKAWGNISLS